MFLSWTVFGFSQLITNRHPRVLWYTDGLYGVTVTPVKALYPA